MAEVLTGFHGKLPVAGDFLTRGLPAGFAAFWDGWAARHLAGRDGWPEGGLRLRLVSGGRVAAGVAVPGADRVGRRFPLAAFVIASDLPDPAGLEPWCDAAFALLRAAQETALPPDELAERLEHLAPPEAAGGAAPAGSMQLWALGIAAQPCDPQAPETALQSLFSC